MDELLKNIKSLASIRHDLAVLIVMSVLDLSLVNVLKSWYENDVAVDRYAFSTIMLAASIFAAVFMGVIFMMLVKAFDLKD